MLAYKMIRLSTIFMLIRISIFEAHRWSDSHENLCHHFHSIQLSYKFSLVVPIVVACQPIAPQLCLEVHKVANDNGEDMGPFSFGKPI